MASFKKRIDKDGKASIQACVKRSGYKPQYATFKTKELARTWAAKTESEMREGSYRLSSPADHHTAAEAIQRYIDEVLPVKSRKQRFIRKQRQQLLWWKKRLGTITLSNLTPSLLSSCRDELARGRAGSTVNRYLAALSHVCTTAVKEWEWMDISPLSKLRKPKENNERVRYLSDPERIALLASCRLEYKKPVYLLTVLAIGTGARLNELLTLKWRDVDIARGIAIAQETKNGDRRPLFLSGYALRLMTAWEAVRRKGCPWVFPNRAGIGPVNIDREFVRSVRRAKIDDFHFHDLRHTAASYMAMNNATDGDLAAVLGHKTRNIVKRYAHLSKDHTASVVAEMNQRVFAKEESNA